MPGPAGYDIARRDDSRERKDYALDRDHTGIQDRDVRAGNPGIPLQRYRASLGYQRRVSPDLHAEIERISGPAAAGCIHGYPGDGTRAAPRYYCHSSPTGNASSSTKNLHFEQYGKYSKGMNFPLKSPCEQTSLNRCDAEHIASSVFHSVIHSLPYSSTYFGRARIPFS